MGCLCSKEGTMAVTSAEVVDNEPKFVNENTTQKETAPLLKPSEPKVTTIQESSSSSVVDQDMIQQLLAEVEDSSD